MKKKFAHDLEIRSERVLELERALDEARTLRQRRERNEKKKMEFLDQALEQLSHVQRQLVEQNQTLKKEVAIAERKIVFREERIQSLESLLQDIHKRLATTNPQVCQPVLLQIKTANHDTNRIEAERAIFKRPVYERKGLI